MILFLLFVTACSSSPEEYVITGKILQSSYTPAVTDVALILGNNSTVDPKKIESPDHVVKSGNNGDFSFTLKNEEFYYGGEPRVMGVYSSLEKRSIFLVFRPSSVKTDLGYLTMWDAEESQWIEGNDLVFHWKPLYRAVGMGADITLFNLYCGDDALLCWKSEVSSSGDFSLPVSVLPHPNYCWNLSARKDKGSRIYSYTTSYSCGRIDFVYPDKMTGCSASIEGRQIKELSDDNFRTFFSGGSAREIQISCSHSIQVGIIALYDAGWSPESARVKMGVFSGDELIAQFDVNEGYGFVKIGQVLSSFSLKVLDEGVYLNSLAEVKISE